MKNLCKWFFAVIMIQAMIFSFTGCGSEKEDDEIEFLIGMSQANLIEPWRITMNEEIKEEISKYPNAKVIFIDAAQDSQKQIEDIDTLMDYGIDLLIISPNASASLTPAIEKVYKKIPVIVLDRAIDGYDYTLYIGPDNEAIGRKAGEYVAELLGEKGGNVIEVQGLYGSPPVRDRHKGFMEVIDQHSNIKVIRTVFADWQRDKAEDSICKILLEEPKVDVIFAQNDPMAYGGYLAAQKLGLGGIKFVGVDGLSGTEGGLELVEHGMLSGTFTCSTGGKEAVQYALDILNRKSGIPKKIILRSSQVTSSNVHNYIYKEAGAPKKERPANKKITVGFSQVGTETEWRIANTNSILSAAREAGFDMIYQNAEGSPQTQIDSIRDFIKRKVDVIILAPIIETGWDEVLEEAKQANIPVILSNRYIKVNDEALFKAWVGSDFVEQGRRVAKWLVDYLDESEETVNIVEIEGTKYSASSVDRKSGFYEVLKNYKNYRSIRSISTDYFKADGKKAMEQILKEENRKINVVFAYGDDLALGAIQSIEEAGLKPGKDIMVVSVDGQKSAFKAMIVGKLNCTVENNPLFGPQIMKVVNDIMDGKDIPIRIISSEGVFPASTAKFELPNRKY